MMLLWLAPLIIYPLIITISLRLILHSALDRGYRACLGLVFLD